MRYKSINIIPKIELDSLDVLSLIYTPGVGHSCLKIKDNDGLSYLYTNRENSVAVISFEYKKSLKRAIFLKNTLNIDAYPFEVTKEGLKLVVENIYPNFCGIDLTLISEDVEKIDFDVEIPVLKSMYFSPSILSSFLGNEETSSQKVVDIKEFFHPFSKNFFMFNINMLQGDFKNKSLSLREKAGGVIEVQLSENDFQKPVAIISDGSAVLGLGNIGAEAGIPVMEGKSVLFKALGGVNAIPLCLKTQDSDEIVRIVQALANSFSGINLEDISAPRCFNIENTLIETLDIPVFHDDQHGTAIVVLASLLNALSVVRKKIGSVKIVISGAGAAAQAVSKLFIQAGATNIVHVDRKGIVFKGRPENDVYLEKLAKVTNKENLKGLLEDAIENADVFIGLSVGGVLKTEFISKMAKKSIIFALANPIPEIMPDLAKNAGAFIVATGRSDFDNQINNSLVFPGLFRGILDNNIRKITAKIKLECAMAIASLIKNNELSPTNILPKALDLRVVDAIVNRLDCILEE